MRVDYLDINTTVSVEEIAELFAQAAEDMEITEERLAEEIADWLGLIEKNLEADTFTSEKAAVSAAIRGVLHMMGLSENQWGATNTRISIGRACQLGYVINEILFEAEQGRLFIEQ